MTLAPGSDIVRYGVVAVVRRGEQFLTIRRSETVLAPGRYCFPGGGIEGTETEEEALVREMREELNVAIRPVRLVWRSVSSWRIALAWWLAELVDEDAMHPNPAEVASLHWHTPAEMLQLGNMLESNERFLAALASGEIVLD